MKALLTLLTVWLAIFPIPIGAVETFALFAPSEKPEDVAALKRILAADQPQSIAVLKSPDEVLKSPAEVLVLFLDRRGAGGFTETMLPELKKKKIIGIGHGAAEVFGALKLEIRAGACAHGQPLRPLPIELPKDNLLPPTPVGPIKVYELTVMPDGAHVEARDFNFAMHLPATDPRTACVTALARWRGDGNYAPIVRQGDFIMVGIAAPATMWTNEYQAFFGGLTARFAKAPRVGPAKMKWEETPPGVLELNLAQNGNTKEHSNAEYRFRIVKPGRFTALLDHDGPGPVMMLFAGPQGTHGMRKDAKKGEPLDIAVEITQDDIAKAGEELWKLKVTNFDPGRRATGKLTIDYPQAD